MRRFLCRAVCVVDGRKEDKRRFRVREQARDHRSVPARCVASPGEDHEIGREIAHGIENHVRRISDAHLDARPRNPVGYAGSGKLVTPDLGVVRARDPRIRARGATAESSSAASS